MRKTFDKLQYRGIPQCTCPELLKVIKNKEMDRKENIEQRWENVNIWGRGVKGKQEYFVQFLRL
jgi:hypothetical protein